MSQSATATKDFANLINEKLATTNRPISQIIKDIAEQYNIKSETLRRRYYRSKVSKNKSHKNQLFSDLTEKNLCGLVLAFASSGVALPRHILISFVGNCFLNNPHWDGSHWFSGFIKRHSDLLSYQSRKGLDIQRVSNVSKDIVHGFISAYEHLIASYRFDNDFIINADESPCEISKSNWSKVLTSNKSTTQGVMNLPKSTLRTILPFVAASGKVWMIILIYKCMADSGSEKSAEVSVPTVIKRTRGNWPTYYTTTSKGFITNDLWKVIIEKLIELMKVSMGGKHALLLLDRHSTHLELSSMKTLIDSNIHPLYLPAHTTHIMQPLDDVILGHLKHHIQAKKGMETIRRLLTGEDLSSIIQDVVTDLDPKVFNTSIVKAGFNNTGIFPFQKDKILANFKNEYMWKDENQINSVKEHSIESIVAAFKQELFKDSKQKVKRKSKLLERSKLFTGEDLVQWYEAEAKTKQEKEEKKKQAVDKKRKREEDKVIKQEARKKRKIVGDIQNSAGMEISCNFCYQVFSSETKLITCTNCNNYRICNKCNCGNIRFNSHQRSCTKK